MGSESPPGLSEEAESMHRGVRRCVMDISGQSSGTDHIRTRSAEVCLPLKRPLEEPDTPESVHCAPEML